jgi:hypothetical protein
MAGIGLEMRRACAILRNAGALSPEHGLHWLEHE